MIAPVKGTHDIIGFEAEEYRTISNAFKAAAELFGYKEAILPHIENTELFARGTGEGSDVVRKEMYTFLDKGGRSITLRPELTASIARSVISNKLYATEDLPLKLYYDGSLFRYERPQQGRWREYHTFGIEAIGVDSTYLDAESAMIAVIALGILGFDKVKVKVNSLGDETSRAAYKKALVEYFSSRIDEMCGDCHERLTLNPLRILDCKVEEDQKIASLAPKLKDYLTPESDKRFYETLSILNSFDIDYEIDESLVRGLDYYSEFVYEVHVISKEGKDYGALLGGGHYGGLVKELGGPDLPGVGFGAGIERVHSVMKDNGMLDDAVTPLDVYIMPVGENSYEEAFAIANSIRVLGYSCELPYSPVKLGNLFKRAERKKARFGLILGEEEIARGVAQLKDLTKKEQKEIKLSDLEAELDKAMLDQHEEEPHHHAEEE